MVTLTNKVNENVIGILNAIPIEEFTLVSLDGVVSLLKQAMPIGSIYNLSKTEKNLDLMIVLEKGCVRKLDTFDDVMDMSLLGYDGFCTLHTFGHLNQQICNGNLFYSSACIEENLIYMKSTSQKLPSPSALVYQKRKVYLNRLFHIEMNKACSFLEGAAYYANHINLELSVFMLQQAVELTYRCFLNLLRGKDMKCHSLITLRRNIRRYAPNLIGVFSEQEEEELFYLDLLEKGYCDARYDREYKADRDMVIWLRRKVWQLHSKAYDLFANMMIAMERESLKNKFN